MFSLMHLNSNAAVGTAGALTVAFGTTSKLATIPIATVGESNLNKK